MDYESFLGTLEMETLDTEQTLMLWWLPNPDLMEPLNRPVSQ